MSAGLTQAAHWIELTRRGLSNAPQASETLRQAEETVRKASETMSQVIWATNPKHDTLEGLMRFACQYAEEFFEPMATDCRFDLPAVIPPLPLRAETRHGLFLVIKEALHNAAKHASARTVRLRLALAETSFTLEIEDDGCGFAVENLRSAVGGPQFPVGNGLANMRKRVEELGGKFHLESEPGQGTKIKVTIPVRPDHSSS